VSDVRLERRLGTFDATVIGVGSMVGAGIFVVLGPAAAVVDSSLLLLLALGIAAVVAFCNATSSAQLAAQYPDSGGTYVYGRERLGATWGFAAGWCFVVGKTASCAAMATTVGVYLFPDTPGAARLLGVGTVMALTAVATRGITRSANLTRVLVAVSVAALLFVAVVLLVESQGMGYLDSPSATGRNDVLQAAGLFFFAFAGYARIATLGEEVRDPERTIPRAIVLALGLTLLLYLLVFVAVLVAALGPARIATSAPLVTALRLVEADWAVPVVVVGAVLASLGALLALLNGIGRTTLAMGRRGDLPRRLADVHDGVPRTAQVVVGAVVVVVVATLDLRGILGFSSFGVLLYYAVANASAWTQDAEHRRWSRFWQGLGLAGCLVLAFTLPLGSVLAGILVLAVGLVGRVVLHRERVGP
jgi:APA family basic amino acid/polyamine antiporter